MKQIIILIILTFSQASFADLKPLLKELRQGAMKSDGFTPMQLPCHICNGKGKVSKEKYQDYISAVKSFKLG